MTTIAYDRPVKDLVAQLSATGHVTHNAYRKTSVTLHHNGGRLSHEGVLSVWQTREASAHFDVDMAGAVAQFVKINEYAWAVGNTEGNCSTISIEMANATVAPNWTVSDVTWRSSARLAGWIFAKVIGVRPNSNNFFVHKHWSSTACAGPYIDRLWPSIMDEAQQAYDAFVGGKVPSQPTPTPSRQPVPAPSGRLVVDGDLGPNTIARWQQIMHTPVDRVISYPTSRLIAAVQRTIISRGHSCGKYGADGNFGKDTIGALQDELGTPRDGVVSNPSMMVKALQTRLNNNRF